MAKPKAANNAGSVRCRNGKWYARVSLGGDERPSIALPTCADEAAATARLALLSELAGKLRASGQAVLGRPLLERAGARDGKALDAVVAAIETLCAGNVRAKPTGATTFRSFAERWTSGELHDAYPDHVKRKRSADDDRQRLEKHVYPLVGEVPLVAFSLDHAEAVMRKLSPELSAASRRHVAQLMHRVLAMAVFPARILAASPLPRGFLPVVGKGRVSDCLYPDDERRVLGTTTVPLCYRVLVGFLAREGMRAGEAAALLWSHVDLERGELHLDENKTDDPRSWDLRPDVVRALVAWKEIRAKLSPKNVAPDAHVFVDELGRAMVRYVKNKDRPDDPPVPELTWRAHKFRELLVEAGVSRPELFASTTVRRPTRIHDLRGTFITTALANGQTEAWVSDRTGHGSSVMINRYRRRARKHDGLALGELAPMDEACPELGPSWDRSRGGSSESGGDVGENVSDSEGVPKVGLEPTLPFGKRILKPHPPFEGVSVAAEPRGKVASGHVEKQGVRVGPNSVPTPGALAATPFAASFSGLAEHLERELVEGRFAAARKTLEALAALITVAEREAAAAPVVDIEAARARRDGGGS